MKNLKWRNRKIGRLGSNLYTLIPKKAEQVLELRKGMNYTVEIAEDNKLIITFRDKQ